MPNAEIDYSISGSPARRADSSAGRHLDALGTVGCIYLALITLGFAAFRMLPVLPISASHNSDRTFFASVNAVTMTGFAQNFATTANYPLGGRLLLVGLAVGGALTMLIGGGAFLRHVFGDRISLPRLTFVSIALVAWPLVFARSTGWFEALSVGSGVGYTPVGITSGWLWTMLGASIPAAAGPLLVVALFTARQHGAEPSRADAARCARGDVPHRARRVSRLRPCFE